MRNALAYWHTAGGTHYWAAACQLIHPYFYCYYYLVYFCLASVSCFQLLGSQVILLLLAIIIILLLLLLLLLIFLQLLLLLVLLFAVMTLHNISHCIYQDVAQISPSLFLTIFLIKDIQLGVALYYYHNINKLNYVGAWPVQSFMQRQSTKLQEDNLVRKRLKRFLTLTSKV